jgi:hypothetical protein
VGDAKVGVEGNGVGVEGTGELGKSPVPSSQAARQTSSETPIMAFVAR